MDLHSLHPYDIIEVEDLNYLLTLDMYELVIWQKTTNSLEVSDNHHQRRTQIN